LLTSVELENFKGISERVRIELRPVTLLFGPNSAGKSTFLQALVYLREILNTYNIDPDTTEAGGGAVDLGGFRNLLHMHDTSRRMRFSVSFERSIGSLSQRENEILTKAIKHEENRAIIPFQSWEVEFELAWQPLGGAPTITRIVVRANNSHLATVSAPVDGKSVIISELNLLHPFFMTASDVERVEEWEAEQKEGNKDALSMLDFEQIVTELFSTPDPIPTNLTAEISSNAAPRTSALRIPIRSAVGALPRISEPFTFDEDKILSTFEGRIPNLSLRDGWPEHLPISFDDVQDLLTGAILTPLRELRAELNSLLYLGPLREFPARQFFSPRTKDSARWASGLGAWDLLHKNSALLIEEVNKWLQDPDRLNTGYSLKVNAVKELSADHELLISIEKGSLYDDFENVADEFRKLPERKEVLLLDHSTGAELVSHDIGTGISQVLPVVVAALQSDLGFVAIEQPELHIHPAMQVALGDLFLHEIRNGEKQFLLETHSEHLMLRILRRIRETNTRQLPPGAVGASVGDMSVVYVEGEGAQVKIHQLRITEDGDFQDRWPKGFFSERAKELF